MSKQDSLQCGECGYMNSEKEYRDFHISKESVLCVLCSKKSERKEEEEKERKRKSKVPIV